MISELDRAYKVLNKGLFGGKLPNTKFRVDASSKSAFRYRGQQSEDIVVGAGFATIEKNNVLDGLLHVMVHIYNYNKGVEDCTTNQYHKKAFAERALTAGLSVIKSPSRGWGVTTSHRSVWENEDDVRHPTPENVKRRHASYEKVKLDSKKLRVFQEQLEAHMNSIRKKQFQLKYVCRCEPPHNSIRSGRRPTGRNRLNISCNKCGSRFKVESK